MKAVVSADSARYTSTMRDVVYILLTLGFFALAYAYISGCARVLGPDPTESSSADAGPLSEVGR